MSSAVLPVFPAHLRPDEQQEPDRALARQLDAARADLAARDEQLEAVGAVNVSLQVDLEAAQRRNEELAAQLQSAKRAAAEATAREAGARHQLDELRKYAMQETNTLRAQLHFALHR